MGAIFGSLAAVSIGTSELFGRRISKHCGAVTVSATIQFIAALTALVGAVTVVPSELILGDMTRGSISGIGFGLGITCYFAGLNRSSSAVVAPVVGTLAAVIPFAYSLATGESAAAIAVIGAAVAVVGLVLITTAPAAAAVVKRGLPWALLSGIGYGSGQIALIETAEASGAWPGFAQRGTAFLGLVLVARVTRVAVVPSRGYRRSGLLSGIGSGLATIFILAGLHVDVVPTIVTASMFPAASVFVGWLYYRDDISRTQVAGLAIVLAGVAGVVAG